MPQLKKNKERERQVPTLSACQNPKTLFHLGLIIFTFFFQSSAFYWMCHKRGLVKKDQSPCHHQTPKILLSLLPCSSSPQLGQQRWRGLDLLLWQMPQPLDCSWGSRCWCWPEPLQPVLARKVYTGCFNEGIAFIPFECRMRAEIDPWDRGRGARDCTAGVWC